MKILVLIGGISSGSLNKRFFAAVQKLEHPGLEFSIFDISSLPFYSQDLENDPPQSVLALKQAAGASDAVLLITPEYNRSVPGVLKNAIDWGSRPPGHNIWANKPAAVMGATSGPIGTFAAQQHLRSICVQIDMHVMDQPALYFNASTGMDGDQLTESSAAFIRKFLSAFSGWIRIFKED